MNETTRRDEIYELVKRARDQFAERPGPITLVSEDEAIADALLAAGLVVPPGLTAERLRDAALCIGNQNLTIQARAELRSDLYEWADALSTQETP